MSERMGDRPFIALGRFGLAGLLLERGPVGRSRAGARAARAGARLGAGDRHGAARQRGARRAARGAGLWRRSTRRTSIDFMIGEVASERPDIAAHAAPDGQVTILFSDIENSTLMTERLGDERWLEVLRAHNALFRRQVSAHGGFEVKNQGDGFMLVFPDSRRAVECAAAIQRGLAEGELIEGETVRVRMGMHAGEAIREEGDFFGRSVILAARIAAQARGGEILVSEALKERAEHDDGDGDGGVRFDGGRELELKGLAGHPPGLPRRLGAGRPRRRTGAPASRRGLLSRARDGIGVDAGTPGGVGGRDRGRVPDAAGAGGRRLPRRTTRARARAPTRRTTRVRPLRARRRRDAAARLRQLLRTRTTASSASAPTPRTRRRCRRSCTARPRRCTSTARSSTRRARPPTRSTAIHQCAQIAGIRADTAWKYSTGDPDVAVAILDTGIRWQEAELVDKVRLNTPSCRCRRSPARRARGRRTAAPSPPPTTRTATAPSTSATTPATRASRSTPATASRTRILDGSDLIATFSDATDADANGYVDDIAGWDFFDDDNDPFDASSCCCANGHGTGRAREALAATDNASRQPGRLPGLPDDPAARLGHLRRPDRQLRDGRRSTRPRTAPASSRARSAALGNTQFARRAFEHADEHGRRADAGLLRHQQRQPQLPDQLQRGDLRRRLAARHRALRHLRRAREPARDRRRDQPAAGVHRGLRRAARPARRPISASPRPRSRSRPASSATRT